MMRKAASLLEASKCLPGRKTPIDTRPAPGTPHYITKGPMYGPWDEKYELAMFGMGCFWCSEGLFMRLSGVISTQVGYAAGVTPNPTYNEVSSGKTNHNEVVRIVYDPQICTYKSLLKIFWETHNPTTLNQQGNDMGTQYRSGLYYYTDTQKNEALESRDQFQLSLDAKGAGKIATEILEAPEFFYAEDYHQQYEAKPGSRSYCGLRPTGAKFDSDWFSSWVKGNEGHSEL